MPWPPNGVIPFKNLSLLLAPLCYVFNSPQILYAAFKEIYVNFWVRLHTLHLNYGVGGATEISVTTNANQVQAQNYDPNNATLNLKSPSDPTGIVALCINCEQRILTKTPALIQHLSRLGLSLTPIIFPWIFSAFSKNLPPDQTLILWDFIFQRNTLFVLADLAVAIVLFREITLFSCEEGHMAEAVLKDLTEIDVETLLLKYYRD